MSIQSNSTAVNTAASTIQCWFRGCITRVKRLPTIMYAIKQHLKTAVFAFSTQTADGRVNSSIDEAGIIAHLVAKFGNRIRIPNDRHWYDILACDYYYGWLPINIKTTTTLTSDNIGNLATCVQAYTDESLDIQREKTYTNGKMSQVLSEKLRDGQYNRNNKKDYYFLVLNKATAGDIIVNSIKGLTLLTPNIHNLPFQVCWNKNRGFAYAPIRQKVKMFVQCLQKPEPSWQETFMANMRSMK